MDLIDLLPDSNDTDWGARGRVRFIPAPQSEDTTPAAAAA